MGSSIEFNARTKHTDVAHFCIQKEAARQIVQVHYVYTQDQAGDIFTKSLAL